MVSHNRTFGRRTGLFHGESFISFGKARPTFAVALTKLVRFVLDRQLNLFPRLGQGQVSAVIAQNTLHLLALVVLPSGHSAGIGDVKARNAYPNFGIRYNHLDVAHILITNVDVYRKRGPTLEPKRAHIRTVVNEAVVLDSLMIQPPARPFSKEEPLKQQNGSA